MIVFNQFPRVELLIEVLLKHSILSPGLNTLIEVLLQHKILSVDELFESNLGRLLVELERLRDDYHATTHFAQPKLAYRRRVALADFESMHLCSLSLNLVKHRASHTSLDFFLDPDRYTQAIGSHKEQTVRAPILDRIFHLLSGRDGYCPRRIECFRAGIEKLLLQFRSRFGGESRMLLLTSQEGVRHKDVLYPSQGSFGAQVPDPSLKEEGSAYEASFLSSLRQFQTDDIGLNGGDSHAVWQVEFGYRMNPLLHHPLHHDPLFDQHIFIEQQQNLVSGSRDVSCDFFRKSGLRGVLLEGGRQASRSRSRH